MRVLLVDDDRAVREALRRVLSLAGYEVQLAEDGEASLESVVQSVPDVVVLDVGLPGIDGLEVCRRVRRLGNRVPILILTARDEVADRIDGLDAGADDYMVKPTASTAPRLPGRCPARASAWPSSARRPRPAAASPRPATPTAAARSCASASGRRRARPVPERRRNRADSAPRHPSSASGERGGDT